MGARLRDQNSNVNCYINDNMGARLRDQNSNVNCYIKDKTNTLVGCEH